tara:strand:- start:552 stop:743 length:192 start_codon:yes stop_codon:yes gene_type:complete
MYICVQVLPDKAAEFTVKTNPKGFFSIKKELSLRYAPLYPNTSSKVLSSLIAKDICIKLLREV